MKNIIVDSLDFILLCKTAIPFYSGVCLRHLSNVGSAKEKVVPQKFQLSNRSLDSFEVYFQFSYKLEAGKKNLLGIQINLTLGRTSRGGKGE